MVDGLPYWNKFYYVKAMKTKMLVRYFYLGITFITLTCGSIHAQDRDFGGSNRYAQENKNITISEKPVKVVFMGNSITEGWVNCHPAFLLIMAM